MGSEDLAAVGASGLGGSVGVEGELPAVAVDAEIMVELAQNDTVIYRSLPTVLLVPQVVYVAMHRRAAAPRPGTTAVAQQDGTADVGRDGVAIAARPVS